MTIALFCQGGLLCKRMAGMGSVPIHRQLPLRASLLTERYAGFRSIDVTEDWRALYRTEQERIIFVEIGTHEQLYG